MHRSFLAIPTWTFVGTSAAAGLVAVYAGWVARLAPGAVSAPLLVAATALAALTARRGTALSVALLACVVLLAEAAFASDAGTRAILLEVSGLTALVIAGAGWTVATTVHDWHEESRRLRERLDRTEKELFHSAREREQRETASNPASEVSDDRVDQAMLLLTLQEVGRRVTGSLDPDTLVPTIVNTALGTLRARSCQVFLWKEGRLVESVSGPAQEAPRFRPRPDHGVTRWVLEHRRVLTRDALDNEFDLRELREEDPHAPAGVAPLVAGGELIGLLVVDGVPQPSPNLARMLYVLADIYALGIKNALLFERIETMARRDGLTGLLNHASFLGELEDLSRAAEETEGALTVVMSDIDHFKRFNDTYGHQAGDHVLREVAALWDAVLGDRAAIGRYGGEEFIAALPAMPADEAADLAETLRRTIEEYRVDYEGRPLQVTASFGVASLRRGAETPDELVGRADELLYVAKENGRNRVAVEERGKPETPRAATPLATATREGPS